MTRASTSASSGATEPGPTKQVKAAFLGDRKNLTEDGTFIADVREVAFRPRPDLVMLYLVVDAPKARIDKAWLGAERRTR